MALPSADGFFKVLLRRTIENQKLCIPKKFAKEVGDELSHVVTLIVPDGDVWPVGLERVHKRIWFVDGWQKFAEHYSLTDGWFLVFSYHGNSTFHVRIYDFSCCDIEYPRVVQSIEHGEDVEGDICGSLPSSSKGKGKCVDQHLKRKKKSLAIAKSSKRAKLQAHRIPPSQDATTRKSEYKEMFVKNIADYTCPGNKVKEHQKVIHATKMFELEHPFFAVILQPCNFDQGYMYVPSTFAKKYMRGCSEDMKLEDSNEMQWDIRCSLKTNTSVIIHGQCRQFFRDNTLKNGDVCLFELIKRKDVVLKLSVLRAAEYAVMVVGKKKNPGILGGTLYFSKKIKGIMVKSRETKKAMKAAEALKIENDAFMVILRGHNLYNSYVNVPAEFVKDHLPGCDNFINLKTSGEKKWRVRCTCESPRHTVCIKGFGPFWRDNNLEKGDVCVFELIKSEVIELKVSIFRASHYA